MTHRDFIDVVSMDLGLQVSLSETFNIVSADFIANDVPLVGSKDIAWLPGIFKADPNSTEDILEKIRLIMQTKDFQIFKLNRLYLNYYNHKSKRIWKNYLKIN